MGAAKQKLIEAGWELDPNAGCPIKHVGVGNVLVLQRCFEAEGWPESMDEAVMVFTVDANAETTNYEEKMVEELV